MTDTMAHKRFTVPYIRKQKGADALVALTAYTAPIAKLLDPHTDILLVGDTLGMVVYGFDSTLPVTVDMMVNHGKAVVTHSSRALVVVDLPFGSYQRSKEQAFETAARIMAETGCQAVKLEGGEEMAPTIKFLTERGIPVMGHVGLMPQRVAAYGGYPKQGKDKDAAKRIVADAKAIADAGVFSMVIEGVPATVADEVTAKVSIPVIGIGASVKCDGQILVTDDMAGLFTDFVPPFVRQYANLAEVVSHAAKTYAEDVKARRFPGSQEQV